MDGVRAVGTGLPADDERGARAIAGVDTRARYRRLTFHSDSPGGLKRGPQFAQARLDAT